MKLSSICGILSCLFTAGVLSGAEFLRNPGFSRLDEKGVPADWSLRDTPVRKGLPPRSPNRPAASVTDRILTLDTEGGKFEVMLIHFRTPLKAGGKYNFSFDVRGAGQAGYRGVVFWTTLADGKPVWRHVGGEWKRAPQEWTHVDLPFTLPADGRETYVYLAANGPGKAEFRNVRLRDAGVDLVPGNELAVFAPGEAVTFQVENLVSPGNTVTWSVTDFDGKTAAEGRWQNGKLLELPKLANGWYQLTARESDSSGTLLQERRKAFSIIPEVPQRVRDSEKNQYGAMVNPHTFYSMEQRRMDAAFMHRIGIRYVRTHRLNWIHQQTAPGAPFDWNEADRQTELYRKYGLRQVVTTGWPTPSWASDAAGTELPAKGNFIPKPEFMEMHRRYYTEMAQRYGDSIAYYEIGNEVDASNFWMGSRASAIKGDDAAILRDFINYYIATARAIKAGDPDAQIGPSTTGAVPAGHTYKPWMQCFWNSEARNDTDIFCTHYSADLGKIREVMKQCGKEVPIVLTEIGGLVKTETYELSADILRQLIKRTYAQFLPQLNQGGRALCKFLLRKIPEVREGWVSEMLDADYTQRPEYVAYATLIRLTGDGEFEKELNLTANADSGWVEAYRVRSGSGTVNVILLNDTDKARVTLPSSAETLRLVDVMGRETTVPVRDGKLMLAMREDTPLFVLGEIGENPGPVKHPEPQLVEKKMLNIANADFELAEENGRIPGWSKLLDETRLTVPAGEHSFTVAIDRAEKAAGERSVRMESGKQTRWYGILCKLPMSEIPVPKAGQYVVFKVSYDQKAENVVGTGAGLTLAFRAADMRRVSFGGGNWDKGTFGWTHKTWQSGPMPNFHRDTRLITLEFYLGVATGKVWIDNVKVEVELWQKSNASAGYIN